MQRHRPCRVHMFLDGWSKELFRTVRNFSRENRLYLRQRSDCGKFTERRGHCAVGASDVTNGPASKGRRRSDFRSNGKCPAVLYFSRPVTKNVKRYRRKKSID